MTGALGDDLAAVSDDLRATSTASRTAAERAAALDRCLDGVLDAIRRRGAGDPQGAVVALAAVAGDCAAADDTGAGPGARPPVLPYDFADPDVVEVGGRFYGYATNGGGGNVQLIRSVDLVHWEWLGDALPSLPPWASAGRTWAPAVLPRPGSVVLYYAARDRASGRQCIRGRVSARPEGPFVDRSAASVPVPARAGRLDRPERLRGRRRAGVPALEERGRDGGRAGGAVVGAAGVERPGPGRRPASAARCRPAVGAPHRRGPGDDPGRWRPSPRLLGQLVERTGLRRRPRPLRRSSRPVPAERRRALPALVRRRRGRRRGRGPGPRAPGRHGSCSTPGPRRTSASPTGARCAWRRSTSPGECPACLRADPRVTVPGQGVVRGATFAVSGCWWRSWRWWRPWARARARPARRRRRRTAGAPSSRSRGRSSPTRPGTWPTGASASTRSRCWARTTATTCRPGRQLFDAARGFDPALADTLEYTHLPLPTQLGRQGIRQIELDVFADPDGGLYADPRLACWASVRTRSGTPDARRARASRCCTCRTSTSSRPASRSSRACRRSATGRTPTPATCRS